MIIIVWIKHHWYFRSSMVFPFWKIHNLDFSSGIISSRLNMTIWMYTIKSHWIYLPQILIKFKNVFFLKQKVHHWIVHLPLFLSIYLSPVLLKQLPVDLPEIKGNHRKFRTLVTSYIGMLNDSYLFTAWSFQNLLACSMAWTNLFSFIYYQIKIYVTSWVLIYCVMNFTFHSFICLYYIDEFCYDMKKTCFHLCV